MKQKIINYFIKKYMENILEKMRRRIRVAYEGIVSEEIIQKTISYWDRMVKELLEKERKQINKYLAKRFFEELEKDITWVTVLKSEGKAEEVTSFNRQKYTDLKNKLLLELK